MQSVRIVGLDPKSVFQVHGIDAAGQVVIRRQLKRRGDGALSTEIRFCQDRRSPPTRNRRHADGTAHAIFLERISQMGHDESVMGPHSLGRGDCAWGRIWGNVMRSKFNLPSASPVSLFILVGMAVLSIGVTAAHATTYSLTALGTLGGTYSAAYGINDSGQVVGESSIAGNSATYATEWTNGIPTDLGTLGGTHSTALAINASGQVAGYSFTAGNSDSHAMLWTGVTATDLGGTVAAARGINAIGQIAGQSGFGGNNPHAALWNGTTPTDLGVGLQSFAYGINASGQVVGIYRTAGGNDHAALWNGTSSTDLGTLGGTDSWATGINDTGEVVGYSRTTGNSDIHATLWNGTTSVDLAPLGARSEAFGINLSEQVVGYSTSANGQVRATLWDGGSIIDLNTVLDSTDGWTLAYAEAINNSGQIVGYGVNGLGQTEAFLLTPDASLSATPLPTSLPLLATGLGAFGLLGWRRKRKAQAAA